MFVIHRVAEQVNNAGLPHGLSMPLKSRGNAFKLSRLLVGVDFFH